MYAMFAALMVLAQPVARAFSNLPTTVPPEPALTVSKDLGTGEVVLAWTATTGPYAVSRNVIPNFSGSPAAQILASSVSGAEFRDAVLNDGNSYYYSIEDANAAPRIYSATASSSTPGTSIRSRWTFQQPGHGGWDARRDHIGFNHRAYLHHATGAHGVRRCP
jgi:hypothetical protein